MVRYFEGLCWEKRWNTLCRITEFCVGSYLCKLFNLLHNVRKVDGLVLSWTYVFAALCPGSHSHLQVKWIATFERGDSRKHVQTNTTEVNGQFKSFYIQVVICLMLWTSPETESSNVSFILLVYIVKWCGHWSDHNGSALMRSSVHVCALHRSYSPLAIYRISLSTF
jgi:hypothetical protein